MEHFFAADLRRTLQTLDQLDPRQAARTAGLKNRAIGKGAVMSASKSRPARPPVPALPSFESLDQTHRQVMQTLGQLSQLIEHLDANGVDDRGRLLAKEICLFFDGTARVHHAAEEQMVFPSLLASDDADLVQHVRRLQQDHGWLEEDWLELSPQLQAVAEGYSWYDLDALRAAIPVFTELYRDHIALEETVVYPASRRRQPAARG
jgi:hemerythrin-like domain-containing protein